MFLPLHIFEGAVPGEMVADAVATDRMIGMVLLRPGWERDYDGRPPVYRVGCSGVVTHIERLPDGCSNLVMRGLERFQIVEEDHERSYRRAVIEPLRERPLTGDNRDRSSATSDRSWRRCFAGGRKAGGFLKPQSGRPGESKTEDSTMP